MEDVICPIVVTSPRRAHFVEIIKKGKNMSVRMFSSCCFVLSATSLTVLRSSKDVDVRLGPAPFAEVKLSLRSSSKNMGFQIFHLNLLSHSVSLHSGDYSSCNLLTVVPSIHLIFVPTIL